MNEEQILDVWSLFKEYLDKKQIDIITEKYIDLLADYGVDDETFLSLLGHDAFLDVAINYYLDVGSYMDDESDDDYNEWDE